MASDEQKLAAVQLLKSATERVNALLVDNTFAPLEENKKLGIKIFKKADPARTPISPLTILTCLTDVAQ